MLSRNITRSLHLDISLVSISNIESRVASKCQEAYQAIEETVKQSKVLHIDEWR